MTKRERLIERLATLPEHQIDCVFAYIQGLTAETPVDVTVELPAWLNTAAESQGVNFSATLQQALMQQLGIDGRP